MDAKAFASIWNTGALHSPVIFYLTLPCEMLHGKKERYRMEGWSDRLLHRKALQLGVGTHTLAMSGTTLCTRSHRHSNTGANPAFKKQKYKISCLGSWNFPPFIFLSMTFGAFHDCSILWAQKSSTQVARVSVKTLFYCVFLCLHYFTKSAWKVKATLAAFTKLQTYWNIPS